MVNPCRSQRVSVTELPSTATINAAPEAIFTVIADLRGQDAWLSPSSAYRGTLEVSPGPVRSGTTYREPGPAGTRYGTVSVFEPFTRIVFDQPMLLRWGLGTLGVTLAYDLSPAGGVTRAHRTCTLTIPRHLWPFKGFLIRAFGTESARTLKALQAHFG